MGTPESLATTRSSPRADTSEVLHVRLRKGPGRGAPRCVDELLARVRRAGAAGPVLLRADSGSGTRRDVHLRAADVLGDLPLDQAAGAGPSGRSR
jgi:hypothetical protein